MTLACDKRDALLQSVSNFKVVCEVYIYRDTQLYNNYVIFIRYESIRSLGTLFVT